MLTLAILRGIYEEESGREWIGTVSLLARLNNHEEAPWASRPRRMTAEKLGSILRQYGVHSVQRWDAQVGKQVRGYSRADLTPVLDRYL
jgi:hypothetical protein